MRHLPLAAALALTLPLPGCIAVAAAGAAAFGAVKYSENEAYQDYEADLDEAWDASLGALEELGYEIPPGVALGESEGEIDGDDYWVGVEQHPSDRVRVRVRIGTFETDDNLRRAELVLEEVRERLD